MIGPLLEIEVNKQIVYIKFYTEIIRISVRYVIERHLVNFAMGT